MRLLTWTGERPAALRQFRACVGVLDRELGVAPLPETTALYDAIRANRLEPPPSADGPVVAEVVRGAGGTTPGPSEAYASIELVGRDLSWTV